MRTRLLVAVLLFATALVGVLLAPEALINPGPVLKGHAKIEGNCFKCHSPLLGPSDAKCLACHELAKIGAKKPTRVRFHQQLVEKRCLACHGDHAGREAAKATRAFDHGLLTQATRTSCHRCHAKPADTLHRAITSGCGSCHGTAAWKPATFDHTRYFRFDRHHPADCAACHVKGVFKRYTCYGCHEHSAAKIREEHLEEGIRDFRKCTECHRSADEEEAERIWKSRRRALGGRGGDDDDDDDRGDREGD